MRFEMQKEKIRKILMEVKMDNILLDTTSFDNLFRRDLLIELLEEIPVEE